MPSRRALIYLALVGALHHLALVIAAIIPTLLFPPDLLVQLIIAVPIFCLMISWAVPALLRRLGLIPPKASTARIRIVAVLIALLCVSVTFLCVIIGLMTLIEATIVYILAVVFLHLVVLRRMT
jgi:hypothetical protein